MEPEVILDQKLIKKKDKVALRDLVKWSNLPLEEAALNNLDKLLFIFPNSKTFMP